MARDYPRRYRVADQLQRELGSLLREVKDPRVSGMITVSSVDVSPDLRSAKIYVAILDHDEPAAVISGLAAARGFLRSRLAGRLDLRVAPELRFLHDTTPDAADRVHRLLRDDDAGSSEGR